MRFSFDLAKDAANIAKHGLSLADANLVYDALNKLTLASPRGAEARWMDLATVAVAGVGLVLVNVRRHADEVRPISLRRASKIERKLYADWRETP